MTDGMSGGPFSAALVGCGKIGSEFADDPLMLGDVFSHAEAYEVCPDTDLIAVVDVDPAKLERCGDRWDVSARFTTVAGMLDAARPDIVSVATPTPTHFAVLSQILSSSSPPRAILCEKPIASTLYQAQRVLSLARERGVLLVVMHMRRYAENMRNLQRFLKEGGIGELRNVSGWLTKGTVHNGTHWFDLLRFLVGEVHWVHAMNTLCEPGDDPTFDVALGLANGMLATMRSAEVANFTICEMDIMGSRGRAQIVDSSYRVDISTAVPSPRYSGYVELVPSAVDMGDRKHVMLHAVEDIVKCLTTGCAPQSSGEDGLEALRIGLAAHESARTGQIVELRAGAHRS
ncbi:MAG TPA: Gfo/Idh/MocA family oxidoreductase [Gemmatimonadaceae bacterium]|nr:Gfo/Idh/MocA family oxidoreductase [Gemmatimonadaceae bacterium]